MAIDFNARYVSTRNNDELFQQCLNNSVDHLSLEWARVIVVTLVLQVFDWPSLSRAFSTVSKKQRLNAS